MSPGTTELPTDDERTSFLCEVFGHKYGDRVVDCTGTEEGKVQLETAYWECRRCQNKQYFTSFNVTFGIIKEGI